MRDWIVAQLNRVNDWDLTWLGFGWLRPAPEQDMTARVVATLCVVYCPLSAILAYLVAWCWLAVGQRGPAVLPWVIATLAGVTFALLQSLLAYAWNRRATKLRASKELKTPSA